MEADDGYRRQAFQTDGLPGRPSGLADDHDWPPGRSAALGRRLKRAWAAWWVAPFFGGAAAVLVVFGVLQLTVLNQSSHNSAAPTSTVLMPAQVFPDALFRRLTADIQSQDKKDFLSLVAPSARPAVQTWWDNMQAIGFTTGLIMPSNATDQVNLDTNGDGTTVVLAGTHSPYDPVDGNKPDVPLERYQLGLHFSSPTAIGQITAWKPLGNAPWDQGKLYVRKGTNVIVAGPVADRATVDETLPIAQAAAAYDVGLINHVHPTDLRQTGFVVFVSATPTVRSNWFSTTEQPAGWAPASPDSGLTAQLPGPGASADTNWGLGGLADDSTGGARVVITPFEEQSGGTAQVETEELVTRFALDILSADNQAFAGISAATPPAWALEGFAVAFEAAYESDTNPALDTYSFKVLADALKQLPASYKNGTLPSADDLYVGPASADWRVVAASVYAYIASKYGMGQLLGSADLMWTQFTDPRGNVLESNSNGTLTFFGKDTITAGWKAYLANPTATAPAIGPSGV